MTQHDIHMEELATFVFDDLKVVTYRWLSNLLEVSANSAKQLLKEFVEKYKDNLDVMYVLVGYRKEGLERTIAVIPNQLLEHNRETWHKVVVVDVYSVCANNKKDCEELASIKDAIWQVDFTQGQELQTNTTQSNALSYQKNLFSAIVNPSIELEKLEPKELMNENPVPVASTIQQSTKQDPAKSKASSFFANNTSKISKKETSTSQKETFSNENKITAKRKRNLEEPVEEDHHIVTPLRLGNRQGKGRIIDDNDDESDESHSDSSLSKDQVPIFKETPNSKEQNETKKCENEVVKNVENSIENESEGNRKKVIRHVIKNGYMVTEETWEEEPLKEKSLQDTTSNIDSTNKVKELKRQATTSVVHPQKKSKTEGPVTKAKTNSKNVPRQTNMLAFFSRK